MNHAEILEWLNERGVNGYSGSISVERVAEILSAFYVEMKAVRELCESIKGTVESD